jgi:hypothetical protein
VEKKASIREISSEIDKVLPKNRDIDLFHEFLSQNEEVLACEFVCDRLTEFGVFLSEKLGKTLRALCENLGISLERGVLGLRIINPDTGECEFLHPIASDVWTAPLLEILDKIRNKTDPEAAAQVQEFIDVGEFSLAVDDIYHILIFDKIPVNQKDIDTLKSIWADFGDSSADLKGIIVLEE